MNRPAHLLPWPLLLAIVAAGLALRIAAARGGLWLDEAWSAVFAADVGTPAGVFLNVHHDNNHHLNTLWLQWVGIDANPIVQRALSIASGTAIIIVAALIVAPRGRIAAVVAATLFAVSPILVTYGSEARGYAPMVLAFLLLAYVVGRWLDDPRTRVPTIGLGVLCLLGTLAQMTTVFGICAVLGWVALRRWQSSGVRAATVDTVRVMGAPVIVTLLTIGAIVRWLPGADGFKIGSYFPFTLHDLLVGQTEMLTFTLGLPPVPVWLAIVVGLALASLALLPQLRDRRAFHLLGIIGVPVGCAIAQFGNVAIGRYFLIGTCAILLLIAEVVAIAIARGGAWRTLAVMALLALLTGSAWRNTLFLSDLRADPARAIVEMERRSPRGTTVTLDRDRAAPVIRVAAAQHRYPAQIGPCGHYLFVDRDGTEGFPTAPEHCFARYRPIAHADPSGLSGSRWTLYERRP